jgi:hypothetical protein
MSKASSTGLNRPLIFTGVYVAAAVFAAVGYGNREFIIYIGVLLVLIVTVCCVHRRCPLPPQVLWAFSAWGLLHMAGGLLPIPQSWVRDGSHTVLYNWWIIPRCLRYDQLTHAYGLGITTWLCWHILKSALRETTGSHLRPTPGILALCAAAGMGFGALNEVIEFAATRILTDTNVGDYENTGWDLVANLAGSIIAVLIIRWRDPHDSLSRATRGRRSASVRNKWATAVRSD